MVLFGSSRKKRRDVFQAAIEQQSRANPATRFGERHYGSSHQYGGRPILRPEGSNDHPYREPGFGFYSGENLSVSRPRQREPATSMVGMRERERSVEDHGITPSRTALSPLGLPLQGTLGPGFRGSDGCHGWGSAWLDLEPSAYSGWWDPRYTVPDEQFPYCDGDGFGEYGPDTRVPPLGIGSLSSGGRQFAPQGTPMEGFISPEHPTFDPLQPFGNEAIPYPYTTRRFTGNEYQRAPTPFTDRTDNTFPASGGVNRVPRPPGSYERLRPPHLEQGGERA